MKQGSYRKAESADALHLVFKLDLPAHATNMISLDERKEAVQICLHPQKRAQSLCIRMCPIYTEGKLGMKGALMANSCAATF
jgi:hypothetical protein